MENIKEFVINLNTSGPAFAAGQPITGDVKVNLQKPMDIKNIQIELTGKAYCYWNEGSDNYLGKESIIKKMVRLCGASSDSHSFPFPAGEQTYGFSFDLPERLPSSFEGSFGYIRYVLKAVIRRHWKADYKTKLAININDMIDTNLSVYKEGKGGEKHKNLGLCCCKTATVDMSASIDRGCYCPGEAILVNSNVANNTNRDMLVMHAKLLQTVTYHANGKRKKSSKVVARLNGPNIPKGESASWENEHFDIPEITPTIINCRVISVQYKIVFKVRVRYACDPAIKMDVVIGTVPLAPTRVSPVVTTSTDEPPRYHNLVHNDETLLIPSQFNTRINEDAPPRYSAVFGESVNITADDAVQFAHEEVTLLPLNTGRNV